MSTATLSVVVVNWNAGTALADCLASLRVTEWPAHALEVIVVDNASTDGSQAAASCPPAPVILLENAANLGFARAANRGIRAARGDAIVLLNPDVVLTPTAIPRLWAFLGEHPDAAVVGPRLYDPDGRVQGSARRDPSSWTGLFGRTSLLTRLFPGNPASRREVPALAHAGDGPLEVDWVSGACLMARRAACEQVGLLDERFFLFWEDADWCLRFRQAGWRVYYVPSAAASHRVGISRARRPYRSLVEFHLSAYRFYRKHWLRSPYHPLMLLLVGGLAMRCGVRGLQLVLGLGAAAARGARSPHDRIRA